MNKRVFIAAVAIGFLLGWCTATLTHIKTLEKASATIEEDTAKFKTWSEALSIQSGAITKLDTTLNKCMSTVDMCMKTVRKQQKVIDDGNAVEITVPAWTNAR